MHIIAWIRTLISRALLVLISIVSFIPLLIMSCVPPRVRFKSRFIFLLMRIFNWAVLKAAFIPIRFKGRENIPAESVIFAGNHQSALDIPLLGVLAKGKPHVWLARSELMQWRWLKWVLPRFAVVVDVSSKRNAMRSILQLARLVHRKNIDIMIFPEGGRFDDGKIHAFFGGFATLAKILKRPVVPVRLFGLHKVYPPNTFLVQYHPITVVVGKPMYMQDDETDEAFKDRVHQWFVEQKEE